MTCDKTLVHSSEPPRRLTIAEYLVQRLAMPGAMDPIELGKRIGYTKRIIIPMFMSERARVPLGVALPLARQLDVPFPPLFRMALEQFGEDMSAAAAELFDCGAVAAGPHTPPSQNPHLPYSKLVSEPVRW
jgi:hypothetical protein